MGNNNNVRILSDLGSEIYIAPLGSTLPVDLTAPIGPFKPLGWLAEDGVELEVSTDVEKIKAMQGGAVVRAKVTSTEKSLKFKALESTPIASQLYWDHGDAVVSGTGADKIARIDLPEAIGTVARSAVVKFVDGDVTEYYCFERIEVTEREALSYAPGSPKQYGFTAEIIGDAYLLTNDPSFLGE